MEESKRHIRSDSEARCQPDFSRHLAGLLITTLCATKRSPRRFVEQRKACNSSLRSVLRVFCLRRHARPLSTAQHLSGLDSLYVKSLPDATQSVTHFGFRRIVDCLQAAFTCVLNPDCLCESEMRGLEPLRPLSALSLVCLPHR